MTTYFNVTQHKATPDQVAAGLDEHPFAPELMNVPATFTRAQIQEQAETLVAHILHVRMHISADEDVQVMLGGHFDLMHYTALGLNEANIPWVTAVAERVSEEVHNADGTVTKVNKFKHLGFR